jgi:hypothetical protein
MFLFFAGAALVKLNFYFNLDSSAKANIEKIEILNSKKDSFKIFVEYSFVFNNRIFFKKHIFQEVFFNQFTANDFMNKISKHDIRIWFNLKNPQVSSIEKIFPWKNCVYSLITMIVFFYFLILKYYVLNFKKNE